MKKTRNKQRIIMQLNMMQMWRLVFIHLFIAMCFNLVSHAQSLKQKDDIQIQYHTVNIDTKSVTHPFTSLYINDVVNYISAFFGKNHLMNIFLINLVIFLSSILKTSLSVRLTYLIVSCLAIIPKCLFVMTPSS